MTPPAWVLHRNRDPTYNIYIYIYWYWFALLPVIRNKLRQGVRSPEPPTCRIGCLMQLPSEQARTTPDLALPQIQMLPCASLSVTCASLWVAVRAFRHPTYKHVPDNMKSRQWDLPTPCKTTVSHTFQQALLLRHSTSHWKARCGF